jgi:hypothetical protein
MFSKSAILGIGLMAILAIALFPIGCSDDKTTTSTGTTGSLTDPQFVLLQGQVNTYLDSSKQYFAAGLNNIYQLPTDTQDIAAAYGPMGADDTVSYIYADGWHITYVTRTNAYFSDRFSDSVQFLDGSTPLQNPSGLDYMHYIHHWDYESKLLETTHTNHNVNIDLEFSHLDSTVASINGTKDIVVDWNYISGDTNITAVFDMDIEVNDISVERQTYGWTSGTPTEGELIFDVDESYSLDTGYGPALLIKQWNVHVSFEDGEATIRVTSEGTTWTYTRTI